MFWLTVKTERNARIPVVDTNFPVRGNLVEVEAVFGRLLAFDGDNITNQIVKFGAHARPELAMLLAAIRPADKVFDLGAHIGSFTIPIAKSVGNKGAVLAVEGFPENFDVLTKNVSLHGLANVTAVNALIAPAGVQYAAVLRSSNTGGTHFAPGAQGDPGITVPLSSIDELCRRYFEPAVIKIDIEGYEDFALTGSSFVPERKPVIYCEISEENLARAGGEMRRLGKLFRRCGYRLFRNVGPRNARSDDFLLRELPRLAHGGSFFDVLAIHYRDERLHLIPEAGAGRTRG